jgi:hypothetical protein
MLDLSFQVADRHLDLKIVVLKKVLKRDIALIHAATTALHTQPLAGFGLDRPILNRT